MKLILTAAALLALGACVWHSPPSPAEIDLAAQIAAEVAKRIAAGG